MESEINDLGSILMLTLAIFALVVCGALIYVFYLLWQLRHSAQRFGLPEVPRDATGRPLRERR